MESNPLKNPKIKDGILPSPKGGQDFYEKGILKAHKREDGTSEWYADDGSGRVIAEFDMDGNKRLFGTHEKTDGIKEHYAADGVLMSKEFPDGHREFYNTKGEMIYGFDKDDNEILGAKFTPAIPTTEPEIATISKPEVPKESLEVQNGTVETSKGTEILQDGVVTSFKPHVIDEETHIPDPDLSPSQTEPNKAENETQKIKLERDPVYEQALRLVAQTENPSTSNLQKELKLDYARAAHILDQMKEDGVIGPFDGLKPREILMQNSEIENFINTYEFVVPAIEPENLSAHFDLDDTSTTSRINPVRMPENTTITPENMKEAKSEQSVGKPEAPVLESNPTTAPTPEVVKKITEGERLLELLMVGSKIFYKGKTYEIKEITGEDEKTYKIKGEKSAVKINEGKLREALENGEAKWIRTDIDVEVEKLLKHGDKPLYVTYFTERFSHIPEANRQAIANDERIKKYVAEAVIISAGKKITSISTLNARIYQLPLEFKEQTLSNPEVYKCFVDIVLQKERESKSLVTMNYMLDSVPKEIIGEILQDPEVRQFMTDKVLQKGEGHSSKYNAQARLDSLPAEIRADIAKSDEVRATFPDLVVKVELAPEPPQLEKKVVENKSPTPETAKEKKIKELEEHEEEIKKMAEEILDEELKIALEDLAKKTGMNEEEKEEYVNSKRYKRERKEQLEALINQFKQQ